MSPIIEVNCRLFRRYIKKIRETNHLNDDQKAHLLDFCYTAIRSCDMYVDKHSRWLGYVQGYLYAYNVIDVFEERTHTRGEFHEAYRLIGLPIPKSVEVIQP